MFTRPSVSYIFATISDLKKLRMALNDYKVDSGQMKTVTARNPLELLVAALLSVKRARSPNVAISEIFTSSWNEEDYLNTTSAKDVGNGMSYVISAIYLPSMNRFVTGSSLTDLDMSISKLLVSPAGTAVKFCDYLSEMRQSRFSEDEQLVVNTLVNGFLQF